MNKKTYITNIVDPKLYCFATQAHKKEFEQIQAENKHIKEVIDNIRLVSGASYKLPIGHEAAMANLKTINKLSERTLKDSK